MLALGRGVRVTDVVERASLFRVEFTNDKKSKEMRWVLFTGVYTRLDVVQSYKRPFNPLSFSISW